MRILAITKENRIDMKILLAEDDDSMRHALKTLLQRNHYSVDAVDNGRDALDYLCFGAYDAAVLDVMMPYMDGFEVTEKARASGCALPILLLTARGSVEDKIVGLDLGANDYLPKPFDIRELLARLRVLTRGKDAPSGVAVTFGNLSLNTVTFVLSTEKGSLALMNKEYQCMLLLMKNPGRVLSSELFLGQIWDNERGAQDNTLWTTLYNLRGKLNTLGADVEIKNRRGQGYVLEKRP